MEVWKGMHLHYTKKNIGKLFKKSIKKEIVDNLLIPMAKNCDYTKRDIVNTVIFAVSNNIFVEYGSKYLRGKGKPSPSSDDVFYHLNKLTKKDVVWLFNQVNHNLLSQAKKHDLSRKSITCGLDIHKIPWYGKTKDKHVLGMERVRGTSFGHGYASIECVENRKRFTLSAYPLDQFTTKRDFITSLVEKARECVDIKTLFLDRCFFDVESIKCLKDLFVNFVIPAVRNKRIKRIIDEFKENCESFPYKERFFLIKEYEMKRGKDSVTFNLVVIVERPEKMGDEWKVFAYATNIPVTADNAFKLAEDYRKRWGIETGYRVKEDVRGRTCSRNYVIRLFFQLLSILLYNLWQLCNLIIIIEINWNKRGYPVILEEFKDNLSDFILAG